MKKKTLRNYLAEKENELVSELLELDEDFMTTDEADAVVKKTEETRIKYGLELIREVKSICYERNRY